MAIRLGSVHTAAPEIVAGATLTVDTGGEGLVEITREVARFLGEIDAGDGVLLAYVRHTSASLTIQENADPALRQDYLEHLGKLVPQPGFRHDEGNADAVLQQGAEPAA